MALKLDQLNDEGIRKFMLEEFKNDVSEGRLFLSDNLNDESKDSYANSLKQAIINGTDGSLAEDILKNNYLKAFEVRHLKDRVITPKMRWNAHLMLAEGEFNRFYVRAICRKALLTNRQIEVFRAKQVMNPRPESEALIGTTVDAQKLLDDLRINVGIETFLGIPGGPNSGISVRLKPI